MLKVHVWSARAGDHLVITNEPWWIDIYEWLVNRICPCCSWRGWLSGKWEWFGVTSYRLWNWLLKPTLSLSKELYKVPIESSCLARRAIFGYVNATCWRDGCEYCWDQQDDAFTYNGAIDHLHEQEQA